jgi:hypothetical protein
MSHSRMLYLGIISILSVLFVGCPPGSAGSATPALPPSWTAPTAATQCTNTNYSASPLKLNTITSSYSWISLNGNSIDAFPPTGNDFGTFPFSVNATAGATTGNVPCSVIVNTPTIALTGDPFIIDEMASSTSTNSVTVTVTPACVYTISYVFTDQCGKNCIVVEFPSTPITTNAGGTVTLTISCPDCTPGAAASLKLTIKSNNGSGTPANNTVGIVIK